MPALTDDERNKAQEYFKLYDADKSGNINVKELATLVRALGYTPTNAEVAKLVEAYDKNDDHTLSFDEFAKLLENEQLAGKPSDEELLEAFKVFDKDGSGALTKDELKAAMTGHGEKMSDDEVDAMLAQFDADGDGKIKYSEFVNLSSAPAAPATEEKKEDAPAKESLRSKIDWDKIASKLPTVKSDADQKAKRKELFKQFDPNGNGYLSLAEVDKGCRDVLELDEIFDVKPVIMRAFQAAKGAGNRKGKTSKHGPDFVEWREFRLLLVYLRQYFEVWQMFDEVDSADDKRVDLDEFKAALGKIESWGLKIDDAEAEFKAIDKNGGGQILFIEFADWALNKKLDLEDDDDEDGEAPVPGSEPAATEEKKEEAPAAASEEKPKESIRSKIDWEKISSKLPTDKSDADQKAKRKELFGQFDPNGNGYLSLAEVDKGCRDVLELDEIFDVKPVIMRAFQAAKGVGNRKGRESKHGADYVEWREFRLLLVYLRQYFEVWQMFDEVDSADDKRVDLDEFKAALGKIESWGLKIDDAEAEFKAIDKNGGGQILFIEFADWALNKKLDLEDDDEDAE